MTIGELITKQRESKQMKAAELARIMEVSRSTITRWENSDIRTIDRSHISRLCNTLDIDPVIFFRRNEVITTEEMELLTAWRGADEIDKIQVRRTLHMEVKNAQSQSETSATSSGGE